MIWVIQYMHRWDNVDTKSTNCRKWKIYHYSIVQLYQLAKRSTIFSTIMGPSRCRSRTIREQSEVDTRRARGLLSKTHFSPSMAEHRPWSNSNRSRALPPTDASKIRIVFLSPLGFVPLPDKIWPRCRSLNPTRTHNLHCRVSLITWPDIIRFRYFVFISLLFYF